MNTFTSFFRIDLPHEQQKELRLYDDRLSFQNVFVNRDLDGYGASSSNSAALCGATCCTRDIPRVVLLGSVGRRGLRVRPNCGSRGDASRRLAPERSLAVLLRPRLIHWPQAPPLGIARLRNDLQGAYW